MASRKRLLQFSLDVQKDSTHHDAVLFYRKNMDRGTEEEILYRVNAKVPYKKNGSFQGGKHKIALLAGGKYILERSENISQHSQFLDFSGTQNGDVARDVTEEASSQKHGAAERACIDALSYQIKALKHLLPVAQSLSRAFEVSGAVPPEDVGQNGQYALNHLQMAKERAFIHHHLEAVAGISAVDFTQTAGLAECLATNKKTGAKVNISDFGVSQCVPIVVQGAIMAPYTTLVVEQPETQVHPTAQLEMGQFFCDLWRQRTVNSIIETHSANILLRLRRLVGKGVIDSKEVSVARFDFEDGKPTIKNLIVDKHGSFKPGLPMSFFGADVVEGLKMGAGK